MQEGCDAFKVKQFQTGEIKIVSLCDSNLKYNHYTSVMKTHKKLWTINAFRGTYRPTYFQACVGKPIWHCTVFSPLEGLLRGYFIMFS